jgi:ADP-heptose:LPS heptosyltransferase
LTCDERPYWIIVAGGKFDLTIKWWHFRRWQSVVDRFRDRLQFVQVGLQGHYHPPLKGVIDLRGKTGLRDLIRLVYHAHGVLCPVTLLMHLAAAVPTKPGAPKSRPCVVVGGGRESPHWAAYPTHQFIHTVGTLPCCAEGGCWKARTVPLGDGDDRDQEPYLCVDVVKGLPRCMERIQPEDVIRCVELYFQTRAQSLPGVHPRPNSFDHGLPPSRRPRQDALSKDLVSEPWGSGHLSVVLNHNQ